MADSLLEHRLRECRQILSEAYPTPQHELLTEADVISDVTKSLFSLAKHNKGHWKSEKQARFLLSRMKGPFFKDSSADAWAKKQGHDGRAFTLMQALKGFGKYDPSKVRYSAHVFVVDNGGVVAIGKIKVLHPKGDEKATTLAWDKVETKFERKVPPSIVVDLASEKKAQVAKNQPDIDLLKSIPGWEGKDILVSFLRQLEKGRTLSSKQRYILQKFLPDETVFSKDKAEWQSGWDQFISAICNKLMPAILKLTGGKDGMEKSCTKAAADLKKKGWTSSWLGSQLLWDVGDVTGYKTPDLIIYGDASEQLYKQVQKGIKAKKPTKKALFAIEFAIRSGQKLNGMSNSAIEKKLQKRYGSK